MIHIIVATIEGREPSLLKLLESIDLYFKEKFKIYVIRQYKDDKFEINKQNVITRNIKDFGASNARNIGINLASADALPNDYFFFPDDDCFFEDYISINDFSSNQLILLDIKDKDLSKRLGRISFSKKNPLNQFHMINCPRFIIQWSVLKDYRFNERYGPGSEIPAAEETELLGRMLLDNPYIKHIQLEKIIFHPYVEPSKEKIQNYAFAQGFLLKDFYINNRKLFFIYLKSIIRPFFGILINILSHSKRKYYLTRVNYIIKGYFHDHS
jgi:hypothetical protein